MVKERSSELSQNDDSDSYETDCRTQRDSKSLSSFNVLSAAVSLESMMILNSHKDGRSRMMNSMPSQREKWIELVFGSTCPVMCTVIHVQAISVFNLT